MNKMNVNEQSNFIWKVADLLRGDYKQYEYGDVVLPFTVLCRLDSVLEPTKEKVLELDKSIKLKNKAPFLEQATGFKFYNTSNFTFAKLKDDASNLAENLRDYIGSFSENVQQILEAYDIYAQIARLDKANLLFLVVSKFTDEIDLHPDRVSNLEMGYLFEELIRKFSENSNETAGEHFTPREVIRLMVSLLFAPDMSEISEDGYMTTLYDPAAGTGGMLSAGIEYANELNTSAWIDVYGQELNEKTYAICKSDTLVKGNNYQNIHLGNSFTEDGLVNNKFHYMLCNPPFGVEWKKYEDYVRDEAKNRGKDGRFGAGLPRISDGSFLFLQHMISKMKPSKDGGSRIGIVFNGSPLFTGDAGSGESEIRRWIIENDWLEAIVALPDQLFYNTGISTYVWIVTNRKSKLRSGKIQLINGVSSFEKMRKALGNKRNMLSESHIKDITNIYCNYVDNEYSKTFDNEDFGFNKIVVERPLRLNFKSDNERLEVLKEQTAFMNLVKSKKKNPIQAQAEIAEGEKIYQAIIAALATIDSDKLYKNREAFIKDIKKAMKNASTVIPAALLKTIILALSQKDETAEICMDAKGKPEPDADLRDTENVPLKEDVQEYFNREVKPYAPDAWIDESKTKIGYEIPFTRHFYKYTPLREGEVVLNEIKSLEQKIQSAINELFED